MFCICIEVFILYEGIEYNKINEVISKLKNKTKIEGNPE